MIRRFCSVVVFSATIFVAAFGQNYFNRDDIVQWAHHIRKEGPKHAQTAWHKTDIALAALVTEAGHPIEQCYIDDPVVFQKIYNDAPHTGEGITRIDTI